jgi:hypothetical protein
MGLYGGSSSSSSIEAQQAQNEAGIKQGQADIDSIFSGGKGVTPIAGNPIAGTKYYDQYGALVTDPSTYKPGTQFYAGTESTGGFNREFYDKRKQDYENFALPQFQKQYEQTLGQTSYGLARSGLLNSGAADYLSRQLGMEKTTQLQNIANEGLSQAQKLEANVNQEKNTLLNQLQTSANPSLAASGSLAAVSQLSQPTAWNALGQLFSNFSNVYLTKNLTNAYSQVGQPGYFSSNTGTAGTTIGAPLGSSYSLR